MHPQIGLYAVGPLLGGGLAWALSGNLVLGGTTLVALGAGSLISYLRGDSPYA